MKTPPHDIQIIAEQARSLAAMLYRSVDDDTVQQMAEKIRCVLADSMTGEKQHDAANGMVAMMWVLAHVSYSAATAPPPGADPELHMSATMNIPTWLYTMVANSYSEQMRIDNVAGHA
jgi:hypothetical protein